MALSSPPTLQALALEAFWNLRGSSCSTFGHTAPSPFTEGGAWVPWLQLFARSNATGSLHLASWLIPLTVIPAQAGIQ
jgi:hypothetical protein